MSNENPSPVLSPVSYTHLFRLSEAPLLALFDRPSNRGNLGTLIRSCDGLGVEGLVLTGHGVDPYDPDVIVSTMGSFFRIPTVPVAENEAVLRWIECLRKRYPGFQVVGTTSHRCLLYTSRCV